MFSLVVRGSSGEEKHHLPGPSPIRYIYVMKTLRKIHQVWKSQPTIEGAGVHLRRAFGYYQLPRLDPFLVNEVDGDTFSVLIIPHTLKVTTIGPDSSSRG